MSNWLFFCVQIGVLFFFNTGFCMGKVLVSIPPYVSIVKKLCSPDTQVYSIVPNGFNAHFYEPTPKDINQLGKADLWFGIGESFEQKMKKTLQEHSKNLVYVNLSKGLPLVHGCCNHTHSHEHSHTHHHSQDLHIWLSLPFLIQQIDVIQEKLIQAKIETKEAVEPKARELKNTLQALHEKFLKRFKTKNGMVIVISHPALTYYCKDYNIEQKSIEVEGKDPRPRDLNRIIQEITKDKKDILALVTISGFSPKAVKQIANMLQRQAIPFDPYREDLIENMHNLTNAIL